MADLEEDFAFAMSMQLEMLDDSSEESYLTPFKSGFRTPRSSRLQKDWSFARELFEAELKAANQIESDKRLAASIRRAVAQDADLINKEINSNQQFQSDLALARRLAQSNTEIPVGVPLVQTNQDIPVKRPKLGHFSSTPGLGTGMSSIVGYRPVGPDGKIYCDVCTELKNDYDIVPLSCEHNYCRVCLYQTFMNALTDPSMAFPPRCCQVIPMTIAAEVLNDTEIERYFYESVLHDDGGKKTRCAGNGCNQVLFLGWIRGDVGLCLKCNHRTCTICRANAHDGDCPKDEDTMQLFKLAGDQRWQRCPSCHSVVELTQGCYHMTCRCKFQFCYKCGGKWKTCKCVQADEGYITGQVTALLNSARTFTSSFSRIISSSQRIQLELEHRQQAQRYDEGLKRRLADLKTLRRTLEGQRDAAIMDRVVLEEEKRVLDELKAEERRIIKEKQVQYARERTLGVILRRKIVDINDTILGRGKGKGKSVDSPGSRGVDHLVGRLVQATMLAESSKNESSSRGSSGSNGSSRRFPKRELSPATRDRMAGLNARRV